MPEKQKAIGLIGLGDMGKNIAQRLHDAGYFLVLYDRTDAKYGQFSGMDRKHLSSDVADLAKKLRELGETANVWIMVPAGSATNSLASELSGLLRNGDIVIDGSNSAYTDSIENSKRLKEKGILYLDLGCAGGPSDLQKGVALMVGGEKLAFERAEDIFRVVSGNGTYGYLGQSGSGHMAKMVHNGIFYGIFPVYAEGVELLLSMKEKGNSDLDINEAMRLLKSSPPITTDILNAMSDVMGADQLPKDAPEIKVSEIIRWEEKKASEMGVSFTATSAVLAAYQSMSERSRRIYAAAKKIITGH